MIPRELTSKVLLILTILEISNSQDTRSYDTNEWIPITSKEQQTIEKEGTGRVLNVAEPNQRSTFFPEEHKKLYHNEGSPYFQEVSSTKKVPKRQNSLQEEPKEVPQNIEQLNRGEFLNHQYFRQNSFPVPHLQQPQQPQLLPPQVILQPSQNFLPGNQQYGSNAVVNIPARQANVGLNFYQPNYQNTPDNAQLQNVVRSNNKVNIYESLNPGIEAINQGLSRDTLSSANNNFKELRPDEQTAPKHIEEKETVQLLYVPLEALNQQVPLNKPRSEFNPQQQSILFQQQEKLKSQEEQQLKSQHEQLHLQRQQIRADQEQLFNAQEEQALLLLEQYRKQQGQNLYQNQPLFQEKKPMKTEEFNENVQTRRRPIRPQLKPQPQSQILNNQNESPYSRKQQQLVSIQNDFAQQALGALRLQLQLEEGQAPEPIPQLPTPAPLQSSTTQSTLKKRKPHQPPLAVYMGTNGEVSISDVLNLLKDANSISVQDTIGPSSPRVFIGPHDLQPPEGYTKFDLPYLSSIESNRVERKVEQLPFFVAPLNYKAPSGYSKIPLPAPHVGSVVVSHNNEINSKPAKEEHHTKLESFNNQEYHILNQPDYLNQQPQKPIQSFKQQNIVREEPYKLTNSQQSVLNRFTSSLTGHVLSTVPSTLRPDPLSQTVNQYELEQINNQFLPQPEELPQTNFQPALINNIQQNNQFNDINNVRHHIINQITSTPPTEILTRPVTITEAPQRSRTTYRLKSRQTTRPTQRYSISTQSNPDKNKYTVLEEFSINRGPLSTVPSHLTQEHSSDLQFRHHNTTEREPTSLPYAEYQFTPEPTILEIPQQFPRIKSESPTKYSSTILQSPPSANLPFLDTRKQPVLNVYNLEKDAIQHSVVRNPPSPLPSYYHIDENGRIIPLESIDETSHKIKSQQTFEQKISPLKEMKSVNTEIPTSTKNTLTGSPHEGSNTKFRNQLQFVPENTEKDVKIEDSKNYRLPAELPTIHPGLHSLINNLQDQSIRSLLIPASIAPTTEYAGQQLYEDYQQQYILIPSTETYSSTTTSSPPPTTTAKPQTTTSNFRQRGRQRARISTSTYMTRRTTPRTRRTTSRRRNEHSRYQQNQSNEYVDLSAAKSIESRTREHVHEPDINYDFDSSKKPPTKSRFRSRGRPNHETKITERTISSTSHENNFNQPILQQHFQPSSALQQPQSYMQFDIIPQSIPPIIQDSSQNNQNLQETHITHTSTESLPSSTKNNEQPTLSIDVLINHPITESINQEPVIISEPENNDGAYVRFSSNVESNPKQLQRQEDTTTHRPSPQVRIRGRSRTKIKTTTKPTTTTVSHLKIAPEDEEEEEEEFYGFFRQPSYNRPPSNAYQTKKSPPNLYSATYVSSTRKPIRLINSIHPYSEDQPLQNSDNVETYSSIGTTLKPQVQIVQKENRIYSTVDVKYDEYVEEFADPITTDDRYLIGTTKPTTTSTKPRIRIRHHTTPKSLQTEQISLITNQPQHKFKTRGSSHFRLPESLKDNKNINIDKEEENYPASFLKAHEQETQKPKFQITIEPTIDEINSEEDQVPYSSMYRPKIIRSNESQESQKVSSISSPNNIPIERKIIELQPQEHPIALAIESKIENISNVEVNNSTVAEKDMLNDFLSQMFKEDLGEITTTPINIDNAFELINDNLTVILDKPKARRRGVWKLVKRPIETFETAESQHIGHIFANSFNFNETKSIQHETRPININYTKPNETTPPIVSSTTDIILDNEKITTPFPNLLSTSEETFLDSLYRIFEINKNKHAQTGINEKVNYNNSNTKSDLLITTEIPEILTTISKINKLDDISTVSILNAGDVITLQNNEETAENITLLPDATDMVASEILTQNISNPTLQKNPWDFIIKTSTSTEISHETEICFRGKCIKSSNSNNVTP